MTPAQLILLARRALGRSLDLHIRSVRIGQLEAIADSGVLDEDAEECRSIMEQMDRACAEIDRARGLCLTRQPTRIQCGHEANLPDL